MCELITDISGMRTDNNVMCVFINDIMWMGTDCDTRYTRDLQGMCVLVNVTSGCKD